MRSDVYVHLIVNLLWAISSSAEKCGLNFDGNFPGIFTTKFGSKTVILNPRNNQVTWDDRTTIMAYCPGGFRYFRQYQEETVRKLTFSCSDNSVYYKKVNDSEYSFFENRGSMACLSTSQFFMTTTAGCQKDGFVFGFSIGKLPVIFAEFCFDLLQMKTIFVHYVATARVPYLEKQLALNPGNITGSAVFLDSNYIEEEKRSIQTTVSDAMRPYAPSAEFQLDELIPLATSLGIFGRYAKDFRTTNMIAWWKPLKFGNWKLVEAAIEKISANSVYDIYAGTAGRVVYPNNDNCMSTEELTYKVDDYQRNVPLYVWNYVSERDNEDPGVVIIGVNSPFFEAEKGIGDICKDICDGIEWFKAVNRFRKMAAMGYIFCCRPEEVRETLANFPQF